MTPEQRDERMASERRDVEQADRHILGRRGEGRIAGQEAIVGGLIANGHDADQAESLLRVFRETLEGSLDQRALIVAELGSLGSAEIPGDPA